MDQSVGIDKIGVSDGRTALLADMIGMDIIFRTLQSPPTRFCIGAVKHDAVDVAGAPDTRGTLGINRQAITDVFFLIRCFRPELLPAVLFLSR